MCLFGIECGAKKCRRRFGGELSPSFAQTVRVVALVEQGRVIGAVDGFVVLSVYGIEPVENDRDLERVGRSIRVREAVLDGVHRLAHAHVVSG